MESVGFSYGESTTSKNLPKEDSFYQLGLLKYSIFNIQPQAFSTSPSHSRSADSIPEISYNI